jgi:hypothetical protein
VGQGKVALSHRLLQERGDEELEILWSGEDIAQSMFLHEEHIELLPGKRMGRGVFMVMEKQLDSQIYPLIDRTGTCLRDKDLGTGHDFDDLGSKSTNVQNNAFVA